MKLVLRKHIYQDLYGANLTLTVAANVEDAMAVANKFLNCKDTEDFCGMFLWDGAHQFMILLRRDAMSHGIIAHEVFHCAHRILDSRADRFVATNQEPAAYLVQWITQWVYRQLKKARIRVE